MAKHQRGIGYHMEDITEEKLGSLFVRQLFARFSFWVFPRRL